MSALRTLRMVSYAEGVSLLVLVFCAMPLKYALGLRAATLLAGSGHGVLFLALLTALVRALTEGALGRAVAMRVLVLALVPFGFMRADRLLHA